VNSAVSYHIKLNLNKHSTKFYAQLLRR